MLLFAHHLVIKERNVLKATSGKTRKVPQSQLDREQRPPCSGAAALMSCWCWGQEADAIEHRGFCVTDLGPRSRHHQALRLLGLKADAVKASASPGCRHWALELLPPVPAELFHVNADSEENQLIMVLTVWRN